MVTAGTTAGSATVTASMSGHTPRSSDVTVTGT
jgi:hypothetical protein